MDVGQSTANALYQQAVDGTFRMEPGAAQKCAEVFQRFASTTLDTQIARSQDLHALSGFGGFNSAKELQSGFEGKGQALTEALQGMRAAAFKMAAAYLRAGQLLTEADEMNGKAIAAEDGLPNGK
ncbi:hypothetical protein [Nocardia violaceofusca]|jgi:hypothetical protein|uniref:hypothetical protein n=1 Tax=Nocardia violaceofusca TaxID=941182 RepID=UPI0007A40CFD|nr:hypothetical protein [Nocardia violaceofusca]